MAATWSTTSMYCANKVAVGKRVAVVGAGGIGFDICEFLAHEGESPTEHLPTWMKEWGVSLILQSIAVAWPLKVQSQNRLHVK